MSATKKSAPRKTPAAKATSTNSLAPEPNKPSLFASSTPPEIPTPTPASRVALRIIKKGICPSRSEKSTLTYAIACDPDKEIFFQVTSNSGGGFFSQEWVSFTNIEKALAGGPDINRITSYCLGSLFKGKSVNTPAFLLAVLVAENLLKPLPKCKRVHELCNPGEFLARMDKLMATKVNLPDESALSKPKIPGPPKPVKADFSRNKSSQKARQSK
jgi:hypothetical protein